MSSLTKTNSAKQRPFVLLRRVALEHIKGLAPLMLLTATVIIFLGNYWCVDGFTDATMRLQGLMLIGAAGILLEHWERYWLWATLACTSSMAFVLVRLFSHFAELDWRNGLVYLLLILIQTSCALLLIASAQER